MCVKENVIPLTSEPWPPPDPCAMVTSVSSDLAASCLCCSRLASISFLNFCCSCCCRSFRCCLGSVCASDAERLPVSRTVLSRPNRGRDWRWCWGDKPITALKSETSHYLELEPCGAALGVWTSELVWLWLETMGSSSLLPGPGADKGFSSRTRLENRAFSTDGSPSERLVRVMSKGGGGFM